MDFPIPVNITVSDNSESIGLDIETQIVANISDEYEGPYSVTPSESAQTIETAEKAMTDNVTVGAIPSNYVGSGVPRKTSEDLTASGPTVTAPAGYYAEAASKTIPDAVVKNYELYYVYPTVSVNDNGLITASVDHLVMIQPVSESGYFYDNWTPNISVKGNKTKQLQTQAAQTITPTTADQTIASGKYLTGAQTIKGDANLLPENIKRGVVIFGVVGTYDGE